MTYEKPFFSRIPCISSCPTFRRRSHLHDEVHTAFYQLPSCSRDAGVDFLLQLHGYCLLQLAVCDLFDFFQICFPFSVCFPKIFKSCLSVRDRGCCNGGGIRFSLCFAFFLGRKLYIVIVHRHVFRRVAEVGRELPQHLNGARRIVERSFIQSGGRKGLSPFPNNGRRWKIEQAASFLRAKRPIDL